MTRGSANRNIHEVCSVLWWWYDWMFVVWWFGSCVCDWRIANSCKENTHAFSL